MATHPAETIALGPWQGRDVLDHLLGLINRDLDYPYWEDIAITIGAFDDPRATDFFVDLLATAVEAGQAYDAASALSRRREAPGLRERIVEILLSEGSAERIAATAELLADEPELPAPAEIRVAALEQERGAPALERRHARGLARGARGPGGGRSAGEARGTGNGGDAGGGAALGPPRCGEPRVARGVDLRCRGRGPGGGGGGGPRLEPGSDLALAGLTAAARLPAGAVGTEALERWSADDSAEVRAAAIAAGAPSDLEGIVTEGRLRRRSSRLPCRASPSRRSPSAPRR